MDAHEPLTPLPSEQSWLNPVAHPVLVFVATDTSRLRWVTAQVVEAQVVKAQVAATDLQLRDTTGVLSKLESDHDLIRRTRASSILEFFRITVERPNWGHPPLPSN